MVLHGLRITVAVLCQSKELGVASGGRSLGFTHKSRCVEVGLVMVPFRGTTENSPAIHRWVRPVHDLRPVGTLEGRGPVVSGVALRDAGVLSVPRVAALKCWAIIMLPLGAEEVGQPKWTEDVRCPHAKAGRISRRERGPKRESRVRGRRPRGGGTQWAGVWRGERCVSRRVSACPAPGRFLPRSSCR